MADDLLALEEQALATLVVRGRAWLECRAAGRDTTAAGETVEEAMREFRKAERSRRKADKKLRKDRDGR